MDKNTLNIMIAQIAFQEMAMSKLLNEQGERIQYTLDKLGEAVAPAITIGELLAMNTSVRDAIDCAVCKEIVLLRHLECLLHAIGATCSPCCFSGCTGATGATGVMGATGATGATGTTGSAGGLEAALSRSNIGVTLTILAGFPGSIKYCGSVNRYSYNGRK